MTTANTHDRRTDRQTDTLTDKQSQSHRHTYNKPTDKRLQVLKGARLDELKCRRVRQCKVKVEPEKQRGGENCQAAYNERHHLGFVVHEEEVNGSQNLHGQH